MSLETILSHQFSNVLDLTTADISP